MPNGLFTTEFWLTIAVLVVGCIMVLAGHLDGDTYWKFATGSIAVYGVSRGLAKTEPVNPAAPKKAAKK